MDNEKLKQFLIPIIIAVVGVASFAYLISAAIPKFTETSTLTTQITGKETELVNKQKELDKYKQEQAEETTGFEISKPIYKPQVSGMDTAAVISGEFDEILQLVRANKIKIKSIKYEYDSDVKNDAFAQNAGDKYNVARLNMEMISSYRNYDNFLKELYKHDHFIDLQQIEIVPYRKNRKILLINCKIKLYAQK